jgi:hypothetical protein
MEIKGPELQLNKEQKINKRTLEGDVLNTLGGNYGTNVPLFLCLGV